MSNENLKEVEKLPIRPFTRFCMSIGAVPSSYLAGLSIEEQLLWLCSYLEKEVIPAVNNNAEAVEELQTAFTTLQNWIEHYFDNLDLQQEVNTKLDAMALDGTLTNLIKNYVDPIYEAYEQTINLRMDNQDGKLLEQDTEISNFKSSVNSQITYINNKVESATSGSPKGVYASVSALTTADPDHDYIYVVTETGKWYYYDTSETDWVAGGDYQTALNEYDYTLTNNNEVPNSKSIGDKLNSITELKQLLDIDNIVDNYYIKDDGTEGSNSNYFITNMMYLEAGDKVFCQTGLINHQLEHICVYTDEGEFVSRTNISSYAYTIANTGLYKFNINKTTSPAISDINDVTVSVNRPAFKILPYGYTDKNDNKINDINYSIDNYTKLINLFNIKESLLDSVIDELGTIESRSYTTYFTTNLMKCSSDDTFYFKNFSNNNSQIIQYLKYNTSGKFVERGSVNAKSYTVDFNGYIAFNCSKLATEDETSIGSSVIITKNIEVNKFYPYGKLPIDDVDITKVDSNNYTIKFGDYKLTLFYTESELYNNHNWNIKVLTDKNNNVLIPLGTDIIGPVRINNNTDFVGGVHGDERTDNITVSVDNNSYALSDIKYVSGNNLVINMKSTIYDEVTKDKMFDRYVTLIFSKNKLHISNNYKAYTNLTLNRATNGGLIACQNPIIKDIMLNNAYYSSAPTTTQSIASKENTEATINTIYGSITVRNIKGYTNPNYSGWLQVFSNENPIRNKVYLDVYKNGSYSISANEVIAGEFEYILS